MKKIYFLFTFLFGLTIYGQGTPIITMVADGDCTGGTPKVVEIYANGTVDFANYSLENQTNNNTNWGNTFSLANLGLVTDDFVYVYNDTYQGSSTGAFASDFSSVPASKFLDSGSSSVLSINGNDRIRIVDSNGAAIDIFGQDGVNGTGTAWEYKDGYAKRNNDASPSPIFIVSDWTINNGGLNNQGTCQGATAFEIIIGLGTYTPPSTVTPVLAISSPTSGQVFSPETTDIDIVFSVLNFNVAQTGGDGYIKYSVDSAATVDKYDTNPIQLTGLSRASHTISMELVDNSGNSLNPAVTSSVTFEIADYTPVADLATLRASQIGGYYEFTGVAYVIGGQLTQSGALQGFAQDNTAGMMIYDNQQIITINPNPFDGITGIKGQLIEYHGVLEMLPTTDAVLTGTNNPFLPQAITADEFNNNHENYESELIKILDADVANTGSNTETEFVQNHNYDLTDVSATTILRCFFSDLAGTTIPIGPVNVTGIGGEYNGTAQIYPRGDFDIEQTGSVWNNNIEGLNIYPNPITDGKVFITTPSNNEKHIVIYDVMGKQILSADVYNNEAISVYTLKAGIYLMKVTENDKVSVQKLMIK